MGKHSGLIKLQERGHAHAECIEDAGLASLESSKTVISLGRTTNTTSTVCNGDTDLPVLDDATYFGSSALITGGLDSRIFVLY